MWEIPFEQYQRGGGDVPWPDAMKMLHGEEGCEVPTDAFGLTEGLFVPKDYGEPISEEAISRTGLFRRNQLDLGEMEVSIDRPVMFIRRVADAIRHRKETEISEDAVAQRQRGMAMRYGLMPYTDDEIREQF
ncbi:MAG TPA: hypothetical protein VHT70_04450 [Candidatus Saccharimonadales bacterium]|jgi:hypothetical protein|nr:hypothetical protein [Candidatus Saccharimonadales bacterium]